MLRQQLLLPSYLLQCKQQQFAWGILDCNTFISRWIDQLFMVDSSKEIVGKYSTALQAARFYKRYRTYSEYLKSWGYKTVKDRPKTGDILIEQDKLWAVAYIVYNNHAYTLHHQHNLVCAEVEDVLDLELWRQ